MAGQTSVGVDLGQSAIKLVKIERVKSDAPIHILTASAVPTPPSGLNSDSTNDQELVAIALRKLFKDARVGMKEVNIALSESYVFTRVIELPLLSDSELESAIRWQAEQYIPLPLSEVTMDHTVLARPKDSKGKMQVLLVAAPLRIIERTLKILELSDLTPVALETEIIASARTYSAFHTDETTTMIVDSGSVTTDISVISGGTLLFTHTTSLAGEAVTRTIASAFNFERAQAEEYKKVYGLDEVHFQGKVRTTILPIINSIVEEIRKSVAFYQEKNPTKPIKSIVLSGGTSLLPGLVGHVTNILGIEVRLGNPWEGVVINESSIITVPPHDAPIFGVAMGLSLRSILGV